MKLYIQSSDKVRRKAKSADHLFKVMIALSLWWQIPCTL